MNRIFRGNFDQRDLQRFLDWEERNVDLMRLRYFDFPKQVVFAVRGTDVPELASGLSFRFELQATSVLNRDGKMFARISGVEPDVMRTVLERIDGIRTIAQIGNSLTSDAHGKAFRNLCVNGLGKIVVLTRAIGELESSVSRVELVRFPGQSPYSLHRPYWENSIAVRKSLPGFYQLCRGREEFLDGLRGLHRLATIGVEGNSYYGGAGGLKTYPGSFRTGEVTNYLTTSTQKILEHWQQSIDFDLKPVKHGTLQSLGGCPLERFEHDGRTVHHVYGNAGSLFYEQLEEMRLYLCEALQALETGNADSVVSNCALFHHLFVNAHPFTNINNSIAMNIVNDILNKCRLAVLPHLFLDYAALCSRPDQYRNFFGMVLRRHGEKADAAKPQESTENLLAVSQRIRAEYPEPSKRN